MKRSLQEVLHLKSQNQLFITYKPKKLIDSIIICYTMKIIIKMKDIIIRFHLSINFVDKYLKH